MTRQDLTAQPQLRETLDRHPHLTARNTRVSWYQKGKTNLDYTEARDSEWQWHQLGHMQVCTSLQTDNHANTSPTGQTPFLPPNQQRQSTKTLDIWTNSKWHAWFASSCPGRRLSTWMMTAVSCPTALAALCRQLTFYLCGATNTQQLWQQNFCSHGTSPVELFPSPAASPMNCSDDS